MHSRPDENSLLAIHAMLLTRARRGEFGHDAFRNPPAIEWRCYRFIVGNVRYGYPEVYLKPKQAAAVARGEYALEGVPAESTIRNPTWPQFGDPIPAVAPKPKLAIVRKARSA